MYKINSIRQRIEQTIIIKMIINKISSAAFSTCEAINETELIATSMSRDG